MKKYSASIVLGVLASVTFAASAPAEEETAEQCAASFHDRLDDVVFAIQSGRKYHADYQRVMPWFYANCRILTELERAVRKLDDENAFVCKPAKGRPKELTQAFVDNHLEDLSVLDFQANASEWNAGHPDAALAETDRIRLRESQSLCVLNDTAARGFSLDLRDVAAGLVDGASDAERDAANVHLHAIYCGASPDKCTKKQPEKKAPK